MHMHRGSSKSFTIMTIGHLLTVKRHLKSSYESVSVALYIFMDSYGPQPCTRPVFYRSLSVSCEGCGLLRSS